ncbi:DNA mismatch repair endonuclease MutL [Breznakia pachnodae]|uniref:DNA mismatch repair protein MutL n=1 Tax=Breznakia pachnodae TaxID=265178 RepID=A0ABU0E1X4_9FIRM|nr:DNA mismatch repair endonuclease MutL [Breznakia pachnodae]MDQ0360880.1 DNA mismatch repair protein MutL [Breznakia pachnodae]
MAKIQRLDPHLTNMIAAGEVVERPSGVIKELVENAIDANSTTIEIHTKQGGIEQMMVIDDGDGMSAADATLAFERHATSKIKDVQDLWRIGTMGFRGEALPSIASVSNVELKTNDGNESTVVEIAYGKTVKAGPVGTPKGTQIIVRNLFQKTPARFKHLKSAQYEFSLVSDVIQKFALAYPNIAFLLMNDEKISFSSSGNGNQQEVIMNIYGRDIAKSAIAIEGSDSDYHIEGYAVQPSHTRATKYYMLLFVNNRMIRSFRLQKAILDAYAPYTPSDRYPIVVLNIQMDPQLVDVNVHPSKWEVRLSKEKQLEFLIKETIGDALRKKLEVNKVVRQERFERVETPSFSFTYDQPTTESLQPQKLHQEINESFSNYQTETQTSETVVEEEITTVDQTIETVEQTPIQPIPTADEVETEPEVEVEAPTALNPSFPNMIVLAQMHKCYILAQGDNGLYIIDQHAAQERYHYEEIQKALLHGVKDKQDLLVPIMIESTNRAVQQADAINALLEELGIHLEVFGENSFVVRSLPIWVTDVEEEKFLQDMIDIYLKNEEVNIEQLRRLALASMACHSSIRFNRTLTMQEMEQVIEDLRKCEQPFHCPHGRPTLIELTLKELEKDFLRVK